MLAHGVVQAASPPLLLVSAALSISLSPGYLSQKPPPRPMIEGIYRLICVCKCVCLAPPATKDTWDREGREQKRKNLRNFAKLLIFLINFLKYFNFFLIIFVNFREIFFLPKN